MGEIIKAGVLHDIGKIKIPLKLLNKKEKLSKEEFEIIKLHPLLGYDIVKNVDSISENVKLAVLMHHEKENGSGYPNGLKGQDIPLYAKICAIADIYDALTTNRAYKKKITPTHAFKILRSMAGDHLNVELLLIFLENAYRCYF
jgi:HD-GYP domain-containing protein (c-di-GMP phosphodiesterase class II)